MTRKITQTLTGALGATFLATSAAFAGSATPAPADPIIVQPAAPVAVGRDWTGFYGGAELGYGDLSATGTTGGDGLIGGLVAGYDYDFGNWVLGAGVDYDFADIDIGGGAKLDNVARLKLRGGYDLGNGLLYATAGGAWADTSTLGDDSGWFAGAGYEHMVTDQIAVGGEVLYHEFDDFNGSGTNIEATTAQVRATYRF